MTNTLGLFALTLLVCFSASASRLTAAARDGQLDVLIDWLDEHGNINEIDDGKTALDCVDPKLHPDIVEYLKANGGLTAQTIRHQRQFFAAARDGNKDVFTDSLIREIGINTKNADGLTALELARKGNHKNVVEHLKEKGASESEETLRHQKQFFGAARDGNKNVLTKSLIEEIGINSKNAHGLTALDLARKGKHKSIINHLKKNGATDSQEWITNQKQLSAAVRDGNWDLVDELVLGGADINYLDNTYTTILEPYLHLGKDSKQVKNLRKIGALTYAETKIKERFFEAARNGNISIFDELLKEGVQTGNAFDFNCKDDEGNTALDLVKNIDAIDWLKKHRKIVVKDPKPKELAPNESCFNGVTPATNVAPQTATIAPVISALNSPTRAETLEEIVERKERQVRALRPSFGVFNSDGSRQTRTGIVDGQRKDFLHYRDIADGDCAFWGLRVDDPLVNRNPPISRADFVNQLLDNIRGNSQKSRNLRTMLYAPLSRYCQEEALYLDCKNDNKESSLRRYEEYINGPLRNGEWLSHSTSNDGPMGTTAAAAYIYNLNVRVWRTEQDTPFNLDVVMTNNPRSRDYINLYHLNNSHYNLLVEANDLSRRDRALDKELSELKLVVQSK